MISASIARPRTVAVRASKEAGASAKAVAAPKASVVDRRAALGMIAGVAAVVAAPSESKAAYGEAANVFGKVRESWAVCSCPIGRFSREESRGRRGERERDDGEKGKSKPRESSIEDEIAKRSTDDGLIAFFLPPALFFSPLVFLLFFLFTLFLLLFLTALPLLSIPTALRSYCLLSIPSRPPQPPPPPLSTKTKKHAIRTDRPQATNTTGFVPYAGEGFALLLPSKWNPRRQVVTPGVLLSYEDNGDAVNHVDVIVRKASGADIGSLGGPDKFLNDVVRPLLGEQVFEGATRSEGGFAENKVAAASLLDVQEAKDKSGRNYYKYELLTRTADGNEGGR